MLMNAWTQTISIAPQIVAMVVVIVLGYVVARFVGKAIATLAEKLGLQNAADQSGLADSMHRMGVQRNVPAIIGTIVFWLLMSVFLMAAFNILGTANFRAFVAQHALMLGQDYALVVMLMPMEADKWVGEVIKQLETETSPTAQRSLLLVLWYAQTDVADHALQTFAANTAKPAASRTHARGLIARSQAINRIPAAEIPPDTESELRSKRREVMKRVSDEALLELDQLTLFLMAKRKARPPG